MNKILYILLIVIFKITGLFSQTTPIDTAYYENGSIKSIIFRHDWLYKMNYVVSYYTPITNQKECGLEPKAFKIKDSAFARIVESRFFLKDSTMILFGHTNKFKKIHIVIFEPAMYEPHHLSIGITIKDSLIYGTYVYKKKDDKDFPDRNGDILLMHINNPPTGGKETELYFDNRQKFLKIEFYDKFFFKRIIYWRPNKKIKNHGLVSFYKFYYGNKIKEYGNITTSIGRTGTWYTYYENGVLASEGEYSSKIDETGKEYDVKKTGKWIYYTENSYVKKIEIWDKGKLIKTRKCKNIR